MGPRGHRAIRPAPETVTRNYHAPPPGSPTGVADYAESLRRALEPYGPLPVPLYHLGNNRLHTEIYRRALEEPGVIVLHDAVLHHFLLGTLTREQYIEEFVHNYSEWKRHLAEELWAGRASSAVDLRYFQFPLLRRVVEQSRAVIVHNPGAGAIAQSHGARNSPHRAPLLRTGDSCPTPPRPPDFATASASLKPQLSSESSATSAKPNALSRRSMLFAA